MTTSTTAQASLLRALLVLAVALVGTGGLAATASAKLVTAPATGKRFGIVPRGSTGMGNIPSPHRRPQARRTDCSTDCSPLLYNHGPVQHSERDYLFFWDPSNQLPAAYKAGLAQWLNDLAAANPATTPISVTQQYYDTSGSGGSQSFARFAVQNGGSVTDTNPYPASVCSPGLGYSSCITDGQIEAELQQYISANHLPSGNDVEYFVLTPSGVDSCFDADPNDGCASNAFCGYHSNFQPSLGAPQIIYADLPWTFGVGGCDGGPPYLNTNQIDSVVDTFSHELSETITDPTGGGWYDSSGEEIGDKCVGIYGDNLPTAANGALYNVQLGGDRYLFQTEFSNQTSNCDLNMPIPVSFAPPQVSGTARQGSSVSGSNGTWSNGPTGFTYQWEDCDSSGNNCSPIFGATGQSYQLGASDVGHTVRLSEVAINAAGASSPSLSAPTLVVVPPGPSLLSAPSISGTNRAGQALQVRAAAWSNNPSAVNDQWQRCSGAGGACSAIPGARGQAYTLTGADITHTIRVQETASNAGGSATVTSPPTPAVGPTPEQLTRLLTPLATTRWRPRLAHLFQVGQSTYLFTAPAPGRLQIVIKRGRTPVAEGSFGFAGARNASVVVRLNRQGRALQRRSPGKLQLAFTFTPSGAGQTTVRRMFTL